MLYLFPRVVIEKYADTLRRLSLLMSDFPVYSMDMNGILGVNLSRLTQYASGIA